MSVTVDMSGNGFDMGEQVRVFTCDGIQMSGVIGVKINRPVNESATAIVEFKLDDVVYPDESK